MSKLKGRSKGVHRTRWIRVNRSMLSHEQNGECAYCYDKTKEPTFDHVHPKSKGGLDDRTNGVMACYSCNCLKADMSVTKFKHLIKTATYDDGLGFLMCRIRRSLNLATKRAVRNIYRYVGKEVK